MLLGFGVRSHKQLVGPRASISHDVTAAALCVTKNCQSHGADPVQVRGREIIYRKSHRIFFCLFFIYSAKLLPTLEYSMTVIPLIPHPPTHPHPLMEQRGCRVTTTQQSKDILNRISSSSSLRKRFFFFCQFCNFRNKCNSFMFLVSHSVRK